ncbi:MAG: MerR family transcriptional regulator [Prolixibacteraceae bacterium]|jgi:DNA-binding transcriptional MerR regulator|nr:MerR family transcriptional regulator [Prolixibacteraceae bacterium]
MPFTPPKIEKHFYSISEVAEMFGENTSLIRFWTKEFDHIKPHKNKKGNRLYTLENIEEVSLVYHLVRERGMTLKGAKQKIKENPDDTIQEHEVVKRLMNIKSLLLEIKEELSHEG